MKRSELGLKPLAAFGLVLAAAALGLLSCTPVEKQARIEPFDASPVANASTPYLRKLFKQPLASTWDAMRMVYKLTPETNTIRSMVEVAEYLQEQDIVPADWKTDTPQKLHMRELAILICNTLKIEGGINKHLFPRTRRYALLELRYLNIMSQTVPDRYVTGAELIGIIGRASEFNKKGVVE